MSKTYLQELPEGYNGNFVVTHVEGGDLWATTFQILNDVLFAYIDGEWYEQDLTLEEMYRDVEIVEFIVYEAANEENEEGWDEAEAA